MKRNELEQNIIEWANDRKLLVLGNEYKQLLKTVSELGELCDALIKKDTNGIIDGIGDCEVCLTILKKQLNIDQDLPLISAWNEIKDRQGKTINGTFIKYE